MAEPHSEDAVSQVQRNVPLDLADLFERISADEKLSALVDWDDIAEPGRTARALIKVLHELARISHEGWFAREQR